MNWHTVVANRRPATIHTGSGATARPLIRHQGGVVHLDAVQIESQHPAQGYGSVYLTPDQILEIHARLTQIALEFLHQNRWGGEDPLDQ
jgi:hypothetical protein